MTDLVERLRLRWDEDCKLAADEIERLRNTIKNCPPVSESEYVQRLEDEIEQLRTALERLLNDSMYKDHPEASQMAIDALERKP